MFPSPQVPDQPNLMLCRDVDSEGHEIVKFLLIIATDSYWAASLVYNAYAASGEGHKVSYGQVWLACSVWD